MLENQTEILLLFLTFISLFSLTVYLVRFNINQLTFPSINLPMFTEEDGTTINNEERK